MTRRIKIDISSNLLILCDHKNESKEPRSRHALVRMAIITIGLQKQRGAHAMPTLIQRPLLELLGFDRNDTVLIVNIDDMGLHADETSASIETLRFGLAQSASLMVPCPYFQNAVREWKTSRCGDLGVHLTLTCEWGEAYGWAPILPKREVSSLYSPKGIMWSTTRELRANARRNEIRRELVAQIEKAYENGIEPTHLDHHMDFYYDKELFRDVMELAHEYGLPMRVWRARRYRWPFARNNLNSLRRKGFVFPDTQMGFYMQRSSPLTLDKRMEDYHNYIKALRPGVHNIKIHVARYSSELVRIIGYSDALIRSLDYAIWTSEKTLDLIVRRGIKVISFRALRELQRQIWNERGLRKN